MGTVFDELMKNLERELVSAIRMHIDYCNSKWGQNEIFCYVIYADSGFVAFGMAVGFFSESENSYDKVSARAADWQSIHERYDFFSGVDNIANILVKAIQDGDYSDDDMALSDQDCENMIFETFLKVISDALNTLLAECDFKKRAFCEEILLGLQIVDPVEHQIDFILKVSSIFNSPYWHRRLKNEFLG